VSQFDFHKRSLKNVAMFRKGSSTTRGSLRLKIATMTTASGYVQTDETKMYALTVEPASKAMPDSAAKISHGSRRMSQTIKITFANAGLTFIACLTSGLP
jgi:hypothetical protein